MNISGTTRVFLILGDPVAQVRAPEAFNHLFARHGADAVLVPANVPPAELEGFVRHVLKARNIDGLWLAIPHKTPMVALLDRCDRLGSAAGAVNAARRNADGDKYLVRYSGDFKIGKVEAIAGTGKYEGMTLQGEYRVTNLPTTGPDRFYNCNRYSGTYKLK